MFVSLKLGENDEKNINKKNYELPLESEGINEKANKYFLKLEGKLKNLDFDKAVDDWVEKFSCVNIECWEYVYEKDFQNKWVKDKPNLCKCVVKMLRKGMDLINMCHL